MQHPPSQKPLHESAKDLVFWATNRRPQNRWHLKFHQVQVPHQLQHLHKLQEPNKGRLNQMALPVRPLMRIWLHLEAQQCKPPRYFIIVDTFINLSSTQHSPPKCELEVFYSIRKFQIWNTHASHRSWLVYGNLWISVIHMLYLDDINGSCCDIPMHHCPL